MYLIPCGALGAFPHNAQENFVKMLLSVMSILIGYISLLHKIFCEAF
jgi:hypothetical protein